MHRYATVVIALAFVLVGCGSSDATSVEAFCEADAEMGALGAPRDMSGEVDEARATIDQWVTNAPDEIRPQVELWASRLTRLIDVWEAGDFDEEQIDEAEFDAAFASFFSPDLDSASNEVIAWTSTNCTE